MYSLNKLKLSFLTPQEIQNYVTIHRELKRKNISFEDLLLFLEEEKRKFNLIEMKQLPSIALCPDCKTLLSIQPVNTNRGNQTGDLTDKTVRICPNKNCLYTEYSSKTIEEWQQEIIRKIQEQCH